MLESKCMNWILIIYFSKHLMLCFKAALDVIEIQLSHSLSLVLSPSSSLFSLSLFLVLFLFVISRNTIPHVLEKKIIPNAQKKTRCITDHLKLGNEVKSFKIFYMQRKALTRPLKSLQFPMNIMFPQAIMEAAGFFIAPSIQETTPQQDRAIKVSAYPQQFPDSKHFLVKEQSA